MKDTAYIIAEYNPFHNGHLRHIQATRAAGAKTVVCVMSGNFVQRGEIAAFDKASRARFAILGGADLVLEIPLPFVLSGASKFAQGAAAVIEACGMPGTVSFGAGRTMEEIKALAEALSLSCVKETAFAITQETGASYPSALRAAAAECCGEALASVLDDPNSVLACEYLRAISGAGDLLDAYAVRREGAAHDAAEPVGDTCSAAALREALYREGENAIPTVRRYTPTFVADEIERQIGSGEAPVRRSRFSSAAMSRLYLLKPEDLLAVNGVNQGLENRLYDCITASCDLYDLFDTVKTKRFTHARVRQILLSAVLGIRREDTEAAAPPYLRVLGLNARGREFLRAARKCCTAPFVMNISEAPEGRFRTLDCEAAKLYELCRPIPKTGNAEYPVKPFVLP